MEQADRETPEDRRIRLRIGINVGDVIAEDNDFYGDGVNLAAPAEARVILVGASGVRIVDDPERNYFPMPKNASGQDDIPVGRIRRDLSDPSGCSIALFRGRRPPAERRGAQRRPDRRAAAAVSGAGVLVVVPAKVGARRGADSPSKGLFHAMA